MLVGDVQPCHGGGGAGLHPAATSASYGTGPAAEEEVWVCTRSASVGKEALGGAQSAVGLAGEGGTAWRTTGLARERAMVPKPVLGGVVGNEEIRIEEEKEKIKKLINGPY
jgi:hypothetical protein